MTQIEVKCKKCRYRFMVDVNPGETEISCVCPRCGQPFMHLVDSSDKGVGMTPPPVPASVSSLIHTGKRSEGDGAATVQGPLSQAMPQDGTRATSTLPPLPSSASMAAKRHSSGYGVPPSSLRPIQNKGSVRRGCAWGCLFLLVVVAMGVGLVWRCASRDTGSMGAPVETVDTVNEEGLSADESKVPKTNGKDGDSAGQSPAWLEDTWYGKADYGKITILFRKGTINFTAGQKKRYGTYTICGNKIRCRFNSGKVTTYRLDRKNKRVITGDKITLEPNVSGPD